MGVFGPPKTLWVHVNGDLGGPVWKLFLATESSNESGSTQYSGPDEAYSIKGPRL